MTGFGRVPLRDFRCRRGLPARVPPGHLPLLAAAMLLVVSFSTARPVNAATAGEYLRQQKGLVPVGRGQVWISPLEIRVRRRIGELDRLEISILAGQRALEDQVEQNRRVWQAQQPRLQALRTALGGMSSSDPQRPAIEAQLQALRQQAVAPSQLGAVPNVQAQLVELINDRNALTIGLLWIRSMLSELQQQYQQLASDPEVTAGLARLGEKHRLGPDKDYRKQVSKYDRLALTDQLPLYVQSERYRFCALADDQIPLTFSWREDEGATLVTSSMVERLGLRIPPDAPRVAQSVGGRRLMTRRIVIPSLRLGRFVVRDLEAFVLPPEGEDLGAWLGRRACGDLQVHLEPEHLRIRWQAPN